MLNQLFSAPTREQTIALGGIFMACQQVDSYARLGTGSAAQLETAMMALLNQDPDTTEAVYGGLANLENGFATIEKVLANPKDPNNALVLRYVIGVFYLARKLTANRAMLNRIGEGIAGAKRQAESFSPAHTNVIANVADLYQQTISTFSFRIQVNGVAANLQQQAIANKIRCLLFSAVRSAILWQQCRGSRFHLMFRRDTVLKLATELHQQARSLSL